MQKDWKRRVEEALSSISGQSRPLAQRTVDVVSAATELEPDRMRLFLADPEESEQLRSKIAWVVGLVAEKSFAETLEDHVRCDTPLPLLWECAKALASMDCGTHAFRELLLSDCSAEKRQVAAYALGHLRAVSAVAELLEIVRSDQEPAPLRGQAAEALGYIGSAESVQVLLGVTEDPDPGVRFWAAFALGEIGDPRARKALEKLAASDHAVPEGWWEVSKEAKDALERLRTR